jgi:protein arginine N-methyltransferase 1
MYSLISYGKMAADRLRMDAFEAALRRAVFPGAVVLDIGTGAGIMALMACRMGAGHVYALEPDPAIQVARALAEANGCADQITFIQDVSTAITLPSAADVMVSDLRGVLPLFQQHLPSIVDARQRLLKPGGQLIAQRDRLWATLVSAPDLYRLHTTPWDEPVYGLDMRAARQMTVNMWSKGRVTEEQVLCEAQAWAVLDYTSLTQDDASGSAAWTMDRSGIAHGLSVWFDSALLEGIGFSNAPWKPELVYGSAFFPLVQPVQLDPGDQVQVTFKADLVNDEYVWRWNTRVRDAAAPARLKADYRQSTFFGGPLNVPSLKLPGLGDG